MDIQRQRRFFLITGPPGHGKTTLTKGVLASDKGGGMIYFRDAVNELAQKLVSPRHKLALRAVSIIGAESSRTLCREFIADAVHGEMDRIMERYSDLENRLLEVYMNTDFESIGFRPGKKIKDLYKVLYRLALFALVAGSAGKAALCEQESFWHKLINCGQPSIFSLLPMPDAVICLMLRDDREVLSRRHMRGSGGDRESLENMSIQESCELIANQRRRWLEFVNKCRELSVPVLEISGQEHDQVGESISFLSGIE